MFYTEPKFYVLAFTAFGLVGLTAYASLTLGLLQPDYAQPIFVLMASLEIFFFILFIIEMLQEKMKSYI